MSLAALSRRSPQLSSPILGLLFAALCAGSSCGGSKPAFKDVLLITVDTLRPDHMGIYGYSRDTSPNLDRRFTEGTVYLRCIAAEASTSPSVVSMLSGRMPQDHGVRMLYQLMPAETQIVVDLLPDDYQTAAFVSNIVLTDEALGIADRFDHYDDFVDQKEPRRNVYERNASSTTRAAIRWLAEDFDPRRPLFLWVHYIDPHGPYLPPDDSSIRFQSDFQLPIDNVRVPRYTRVDDVSDGRYYVDRYDEEIAYTDEEIEKVFLAYGRLRPFDDALVLFSADHGESMMEHERWFTHSYHAYDEIVHVPLMVRGPGVPATRIDRLTSGLDITPTILRHVGAKLPAYMSGVDLRDPSTVLQDRFVYSEAAQPQRQIRAAFQHQNKWMALLDVDSGELVGGRHYDLEEDPHELHASPLHPSRLPQAFKQVIRQDPDPGGVPAELSMGRQRDGPKVNMQNLSPEARLAMEALGYIGGDDEEDASDGDGHDH